MKGVKRGRREKEGGRVASLFAGLLLTGLAFLAPARSEQNGLTSSRGALRSRDRVGAPRPELSLLEGPPSFSASRFLPGGDRRMGQQPGLSRRQGALQPPGPAPLPRMPHELLPVRGELSGRALRPRLRSRDCLPPVPRRRVQPCRDPEPGAPRLRASDRPLLPVSLGDARGSEAPLRISAGGRSRRLPRAGVRWRPCAAGRAWQPGRAPASEPVLRWQPGYVVLDLPQRAPRRTQLD